MKNRIAIFLYLILIMICTACAGPAATGQRNETTKRSLSELDTGTRLYQRGCYHQSLSRFFLSFELFVSFDKLEGAAICLNNIGNVYNALNDIDTAILFYDEAFATYTLINDKEGMIHTLGNKATALAGSGHLSEAAITLSRAEELAGPAQDTFPMLLFSRGILEMKQQHFDKAEKILVQALDRINPQHTPDMAAIHFTLGELMMKTRRHEASIPHFQKALLYDRQALFQRGIAKDLAAIGDAKAAIGKQKEAIAYYKRSLMIFALMDIQEEKDTILKKLEAATEKNSSDMPMVQFLMDYWDKNGSSASLCD